MTNEEVIIELRDLISDDRTDKENKALLIAIEAVRKTDSFTHVLFTTPRSEKEYDGFIDQKRQLLFYDWITVEMAQKYNWTWKEDEA